MKDEDVDKKDYVFDFAPKVLIARSSYRKAVIDDLYTGASKVLKGAKADHDTIEVHGALELPAVVAMAQGKYDAFITLGCIIKGGTMHDEVIAYAAFDALQKLSVDKKLAIGNGILTVNTIEQAEERADPKRQNRGAEAARAALDMLNVKIKLGLR